MNTSRFLEFLRARPALVVCLFALALAIGLAQSYKTARQGPAPEILATFAPTSSNLHVKVTRKTPEILPQPPRPAPPVVSTPIHAPAFLLTNLPNPMLSIHGPVWLDEESPVASLFPSKPKDELVVYFLGSSVSMANPPQEIQPQLADDVGRMSRSLPLFLAEQVYFSSRANAVTLIPWVTSGGSGFVVGGKPWSDEAGLNFAKRGKPAGDFVCVMHLLAESDPWQVELRLLRA